MVKMYLPYSVANRRPRRRRLALVVILLLVLVALVAYPLWLPLVASWLIVDEMPKRSDVIIILSGEPVERVEAGVKLYRQGYAPRLLMSGGPLEWNITAAGIMREEAIALGVPADAVLVETRATSTYENAMYSRKVLEDQGLWNALVVSSPYHMRRVQYIFERVFSGSGIELIYVAASPARFQVQGWWSDGYSVERLGLEYAKLAWYFLKRL